MTLTLASIITVLLLAMLVEALVDYGKMIFVEHKVVWPKVATILCGIALAVLANIDMLAALGVVFIVPYVGCVITGILISRGSNYLFAFIKRFTEVKSGATVPEGIITFTEKQE